MIGWSQSSRNSPSQHRTTSPRHDQQRHNRQNPNRPRHNGLFTSSTSHLWRQRRPRQPWRLRHPRRLWRHPVFTACVTWRRISYRDTNWTLIWSPRSTKRPKRNMSEFYNFLPFHSKPSLSSLIRDHALSWNIFMNTSSISFKNGYLTQSRAKKTVRILLRKHSRHLSINVMLTD